MLFKGVAEADDNICRRGIKQIEPVKLFQGQRQQVSFDIELGQYAQ